MTPLPATKPDDLELDLPSLDGGALDGDEEADAAKFDDATLGGGHAEHDTTAYDDATGEDRPIEDQAFGAEGSEGGWLVDAEGAGHSLDIGGFDLGLGEEEKVLGDDEAETGSRGLEDLIAIDEVVVADGGEEGPLADDEELREEDLPALDADDDGDVPDEMLFDRALLTTADDDLRWADRAWERTADPGPVSVDETDESGLLVVPSDASARDQAWKQLDAAGRVVAAAFVPGGSVVVAVGRGEKALLVRISTDGEARIIAEVEAADDKAVVTGLRWDGGQLLVTGNFGVEAYRPA